MLILDGNDQLLLSMSARQSVDTAWFEQARADLTGLLDYMRGRDADLPSVIRLDEASPSAGGAHPYAAVIREFLHRPAIIAAAAVGPLADIAAGARQCGADHPLGEIHRQ